MLQFQAASSKIAPEEFKVKIYSKSSQENIDDALAKGGEKPGGSFKKWGCQTTFPSPSAFRGGGEGGGEKEFLSFGLPSFLHSAFYGIGLRRENWLGLDMGSTGPGFWFYPGFGILERNSADEMLQRMCFMVKNVRILRDCNVMDEYTNMLF